MRNPGDAADELEEVHVLVCERHCRVGIVGDTSARSAFVPPSGGRPIPVMSITQVAQSKLAMDDLVHSPGVSTAYLFWTSHMHQI